MAGMSSTDPPRYLSPTQPLSWAVKAHMGRSGARGASALPFSFLFCVCVVCISFALFRCVPICMREAYSAGWWWGRDHLVSSP